LAACGTLFYDPHFPLMAKYFFNGRRPLPANLPRERVEYDLPDDQKTCPCCRGQMHRMGEAVTEQLHIEVKAKVLQNVRFKYACRHCDRTGSTPLS
jgi:transposase